MRHLERPQYLKWIFLGFQIRLFSSDDVVPKFRLPFDQLEGTLTLQSMKDYVLVQKMRPSFPQVWNKKDQVSFLTVKHIILITVISKKMH